MFLTIFIYFIFAIIIILLIIMIDHFIEMKKSFIVVVIFLSIISLSFSKKYDIEKNEIRNIKEEKLNNEEKSFNNKTKRIFLEENENTKELVRKSNGYWKIFLTLFILSFAFAGGFVYFDILLVKFLGV